MLCAQQRVFKLIEANHIVQSPVVNNMLNIINAGYLMVQDNEVLLVAAETIINQYIELCRLKYTYINIEYL